MIIWKGKGILGLFRMKEHGAGMCFTQESFITQYHFFNVESYGTEMPRATQDAQIASVIC